MAKRAVSTAIRAPYSVPEVQGILSAEVETLRRERDEGSDAMPQAIRTANAIGGLMAGVLKGYSLQLEYHRLRQEAPEIALLEG